MEEEKANDLIGEMLQHQAMINNEDWSLNNAKQCALTAQQLLIDHRKEDLNDPDITSDQIESVNMVLNGLERVKEAINKIRQLTN